MIKQIELTHRIVSHLFMFLALLLHCCWSVFVLDITQVFWSLELEIKVIRFKVSHVHTAVIVGYRTVGVHRS